MGGETLLSVLVGIGLSAACGFRVFVPLLVMSIASLSGHLSLSAGAHWIGTYPALIAFIAATALEVLGYYIPWVDHLLDLIATPAAVVAGVVVMAGTVQGMSPFLRWSLAVIAGGGIAGMVQIATGTTRLASSAATGGLANPLVSTAELAGSAGLSLLAILLPIAAAVIAVGVVLLIGKRVLRSSKK